MPYILNIATSVPAYPVTKNDFVNFYSDSLGRNSSDVIRRKLRVISEKTQIENRYSCIPDFSDAEQKELFTEKNYDPSVEARQNVFCRKAVPLGTNAISELFRKTGVKANEVTHLITVTCTGVMAPGLEFLLAEQTGLQHTEKIGLNYLGCYAALKALKQAQYIAKAEPSACVLVVCVELCSLHFVPSMDDEAVLANLLFSDGAAALLVCGDDFHCENKGVVLHIDDIGSSYIPGTMDLMTWNISSKAFRMFLSKHIADEIGKSIQTVVREFLKSDPEIIDLWAIHPGGVKIIEAVQKNLELSDEAVRDSFSILREYGNMSSPTVLFILCRMLDRMNEGNFSQSKNIFTCAFGPGLNIEMLKLSAHNEFSGEKILRSPYAVPSTVL